MEDNELNPIEDDDVVNDSNNLNESAGFDLKNNASNRQKTINSKQNTESNYARELRKQKNPIRTNTSVSSNGVAKSANGVSKATSGVTKTAGKAMPKGLNMVQDAKDVSRGLEGIGSAMSGDYKKMDGDSKKQADMDTAQGIKAAAGYTGIGKPIVAAIDSAEQIPIAGGAVKKAEQKIGKKVNKTMGKISKIPVVGKKLGNTVKDVGGMGSQVLSGEKAAYNKKQESEIKSLPNSVGSNINAKQKLESGADQMAAKAALNLAKKANPALNMASKIPGVGGMMEDAAAQAVSMAKDKIKKKIKMQILSVVGAIFGNPITWIIILCTLVLLLILSFGKALVGGDDPQATKDYCKSNPTEAVELKMKCD